MKNEIQITSGALERVPFTLEALGTKVLKDYYLEWPYGISNRDPSRRRKVRDYNPLALSAAERWLKAFQELEALPETSDLRRHGLVHPHQLDPFAVGYVVIQPYLYTHRDSDSEKVRETIGFTTVRGWRDFYPDTFPTVSDTWVIVNADGKPLEVSTDSKAFRKAVTKETLALKRIGTQGWNFKQPGSNIFGLDYFRQDLHANPALPKELAVISGQPQT